MIGYCGLTSNLRNGFLYVPKEFVAYTSGRDVIFRVRDNLVRSIDKSVGECRVTRERLEGKGWIINEINIPPVLLVDFRSHFLNDLRRMHANPSDLFMSRETHVTLDRIFNIALDEIRYLTETYPHH